MKTKTFLQIVCLIGALFLTTMNLSAQFPGTGGGDGTAGDPYIITTAEQLNALRGGGNENRYFKLGNDIDLGAWLAASTDPDIQEHGWNPPDVYRKTFDGAGHKITGFWSNRPSNNVGLFYQVNVGGDESPIIKNLTLVIDNTHKVIGNNETGGLIAKVNGHLTIPVKIINCHVIGDVEGTSAIGGIIGRMQAALEITGCSFQGSVTGTTLVGGIIGQKYEGAAPLLMSGCFTKNSQIAGTNNNIGGLIGTVGRNSKIENSYVEGGSVTSSGGSVGGLIGNLGHSGSQSNEGYLTVIGCYATNTVTGTNSIGGLIGEIRLAGPSSTNAANLSVTQSYTGGIIQGNGAVGGLVGQIVNTNNALISECYTTASVTSAGGDIGGLVGNIPVNENTTPAITQSFALNSVITGSNNTGVLVGGNPSNTTITNGYAYDIFNAITPNAAVVTGFITKKAITTQATYVTEGWDFTNTWKWGNEYYRLPVLKNIAIQPIVQPAHLPLNGNASLNNLAVSIGILTPTFDPATIDYAVGLVYADENITITAAAAGENAIITGDGVKSLNVGDNEFTIHVEAEDQVTTTDYTLTVYREASPDDATLKELTVDEGDLDPVFAPSTTAYTVNVTNEITSINIAAISYSSKATLTGAGLKENLIVGDNDFSIVVTSEDGQVTKTYTVKVVRAPNTDATLGSLTVSEGTLDPVFDPAIVSYTVNIGNDITSIDLTATANNADATVSGDGTKNNLIVGDNGFNIVVTAQDATVTKTYTVKVVRAPIVAIKDVQNENIRFYVQDRTIVVESAQGIVTLTNLMGVSQKYASKGLLNIPVSNSGIYILTINGASYKVLVK